MAAKKPAAPPPITTMLFMKQKYVIGRCLVCLNRVGLFKIKQSDSFVTNCAHMNLREALEEALRKRPFLEEALVRTY